MENFEETYRQCRRRDEDRAAELVRALTKAGRQEDVFRASADARYRERLYREFGL